MDIDHMNNDIMNMLDEQYVSITLYNINCEWYYQFIPLLETKLSKHQYARFHKQIMKKISNGDNFDARQYILTTIEKIDKTKQIIYWRRQKRRFIGLGN